MKRKGVRIKEAGESKDFIKNKERKKKENRKKIRRIAENAFAKKL